jgi:hypothetical protein
MAKDSPLTVAGAAAELGKFSRTAFPFDPQNGNRRDYARSLSNRSIRWDAPASSLDGAFCSMSPKRLPVSQRGELRTSMSVGAVMTNMGPGGGRRDGACPRRAAALISLGTGRCGCRRDRDRSPVRRRREVSQVIVPGSGYRAPLGWRSAPSRLSGAALQGLLRNPRSPSLFGRRNRPRSARCW